MGDHHPNAAYPAKLKEHSQHITLHALGNDPDVWGLSDLPFTQFLPSAFWTPNEKRALFRSITRHSRYRPDLISIDVGTKNVVEVSTYLELLAEASNHTPQPISDLPYATESSNSWIKFEERQAALLINEQRTNPRLSTLKTDMPSRRSKHDVDFHGGREHHKRARMGDEKPSTLLNLAALRTLQSVSKSLFSHSDSDNNHDQNFVPLPPASSFFDTPLDDQSASVVDPIISEKLGALKLDAETLERDEIYLFHLGKLAALLKAHHVYRTATGADPRIFGKNNRRKKAVHACVDYSLLGLLVQYLKGFVRAAIGQIIDYAENSQDARSGTRLFRGDPTKIKEEHVVKALRSLGFQEADDNTSDIASHYNNTDEDNDKDKDHASYRATYLGTNLTLGGFLQPILVSHTTDLLAHKAPTLYGETEVVIDHPQILGRHPTTPMEWSDDHDDEKMHEEMDADADLDDRDHLFERSFQADQWASVGRNPKPWNSHKTKSAPWISSSSSEDCDQDQSGDEASGDDRRRRG